MRFEGIWTINDRHGLRVMLAPLSYSETGRIDQPVQFAGEAYSTAAPLQAEYRFNSWRVGYRYRLHAGERSTFWVGGKLKVRDAEIRLEQGSVSSSDDDLGVIPLLYLAGEYRLGSRWMLAADLDGLAGGPGRAIDLGASMNYQISEPWRVGLEFRLLEGGADIDELYNFAWFNSALVTAQVTF